MQSAKADAVWLALPNTTTLNVIHSCIQQGLKFKTYLGGGGGFAGAVLVPLRSRV